MRMGSILLGDVRAVQTGRVKQRVENRIIGRVINKVTKGIWK